VSAAIEIRGVSKMFRLYREKPSSLKQRLLTSRARADEFWALRDIALDVAEGTTFGLIGHNGSGKTTLLKCIAGILRPTAGTIRQRGRLAALLELGAGFHPELTGRENVYLNASFLGMSRRETQRAYDGIVSFAELEEFMDNQVKFFSSGMLVRLGFAIAVHADPSVLLVDEVLAVGDEAFQAKCIDRIRQFQREGRTIVLVTHALDTVIANCDEAAMLDHGRLHMIGRPDEVVHEMRRILLGVPEPAPAVDAGTEEGSEEVEVAEVHLLRADGTAEGPVRRHDPITIQVDLRTNEPVEDLDVDVAVLDGGTNRPVLDARTSRAGIDLGRVDGKRRVRFRVEGFPYEAGRYRVTAGVSSRRTGRPYDARAPRLEFEVVDPPGTREWVDVPVSIEVEDL
jgi:ABC-2 type transport system ATP-binding protein